MTIQFHNLIMPGLNWAEIASDSLCVYYWFQPVLWISSNTTSWYQIGGKKGSLLWGHAFGPPYLLQWWFCTSFSRFSVFNHHYARELFFALILDPLFYRETLIRSSLGMRLVSELSVYIQLHLWILQSVIDCLPKLNSITQQEWTVPRQRYCRLSHSVWPNVKYWPCCDLHEQSFLHTCTPSY